MKRSRFSEEQIIAVLKEQENGLPTKDVCRRHGISSATFYKWKSLLGALEVLSGLLFENFPFQTCPAKFLRDIGLPDLDLLTDFTVFLRNRLGLLKRYEARRRIWVWRPRNRRI